MNSSMGAGTVVRRLLEGTADIINLKDLERPSVKDIVDARGGKKNNLYQL